MSFRFIGPGTPGKGTYDPRELDAFGRGLEGLEKKFIETVIKEAHAKVVTELAKHIFEGTPVLTGKARRNWMFSVGSPSPETVEDVAGVQFTGDPETEEEKARVKEAVQELLEGEAGRTFYIANNLDYVVGLEAGTGSLKAPDGITLIAILKTLERLKRGETE